MNVKLIIEGMEEVGSHGLLELTRRMNDSFFSDVDFIVISDNVWTSNTPALTYGTRGSSYFLVEVTISSMINHSFQQIDQLACLSIDLFVHDHFTSGVL